MVKYLKFIVSRFNLTNYEAFVKKTIANKEMLKEKEVILVRERCSAIIRNEMSIPKKMKDPGSCTIPCYVTSENFDKALCD